MLQSSMIRSMINSSIIDPQMHLSAIPLSAHNPGPMTGAGNWTWLIRGRVPTLIDAGVGDARHLDELEQALEGAPLAQVVVTHAHPDHAGGVMAIAERMPSARFLKIPWSARDHRWPVRWEALADGGALSIGDTSATVLHTPGHAPDHACLWHPDSRSLFGGDLAIEGTTVWIPATLGGDLTAYLASLARVMALDPARIFPGHGPIIAEPGRLLRSYVEHRRDREREVIDALEAGVTDPRAIAARIYPALNEAFVPRAEETVTAHLLKLERDGVAGRRGDAWHIIER
jgi:glyoxylase-like metal-dependent hydrolase (beta-lactamase superfamily II)